MESPSGAPDPYVSVAITAYNEAARLPPSLERTLPYLESRGYRYEVVVNDDGSTDTTAEVVRDFARRYPGQVRLVQSPVNEGKGAGIRRAVLASRGQYVLFSDADFSTPIEELPRLLAALDQGYDVAIGSRIQPDGTDMRTFSQPFYRRLFGQVFHRLADPFIVRGIKDTKSCSATPTSPASSSTWKCCTWPSAGATASWKCRCNGPTPAGHACTSRCATRCASSTTCCASPGCTGTTE